MARGLKLKPLSKKEAIISSSSLGIRIYRWIWHLVYTGCRASMGQFPPPLLIRAYYLFYA